MDFGGLKKNYYGTILCDAPWKFEAWSVQGDAAHGVPPYPTMTVAEIAALPVGDLAAENSVLFMWVVWPQLPEALQIINGWGFRYKTCGFAWMKANVSTINLFPDPVDAYMGMGYWTRANSEVALLATRGQPKRLNADVRQGIIEPKREHSRKPSCVYERIERLVDGPYLELFARNTRPGWTSWGNETGKYGNVISREQIEMFNGKDHEPQGRDVDSGEVGPVTEAIGEEAEEPDVGGYREAPGYLEGRGDRQGTEVTAPEECGLHVVREEA